MGLIHPEDAAEMRLESRTRMAKVWYDVMTTKQRRRKHRFTARELGGMLMEMPDEMRKWLVRLGEMQERGELQEPLRLGLEERRRMTGRETLRNIRAEEAFMKALMPGLPPEFLTKPYKKEKKPAEGKKMEAAKGKGPKRKASQQAKGQKKRRGQEGRRAETESESSESESHGSSDDDSSSGNEGDDMDYKGKGLMLFNLEAAPEMRDRVSSDQVLEMWPMQILEVGTGSWEASAGMAEVISEEHVSCMQMLALLVPDPVATMGGQMMHTVLEVDWHAEGHPKLEWAKLQLHRRFRACLIIILRALFRRFAWYRKADSAIIVRRWGDVVLAKDYKRIQAKEAGG
jgi:hypothetical protein